MSDSDFDIDHLLSDKVVASSEIIDEPIEAGSLDTSSIEGITETAFDTVTNLPSGEGEKGMQIDAGMAALGSDFYVNVLLPELVNGLGEYFTESEKNHLPSQKVMKSYQKITDAALQSGGISLPSPTQMFYICTIIIMISASASIFMERKKQKRKTSVKIQRINEQFNDATEQTSEPVKSRDTVVALPENEAKRSNFEIDEQGRYIRDPKRVYIPIPDRFLKPSEKVAQMIKDGLTNKQIKAKLNE